MHFTNEIIECLAYSSPPPILCGMHWAFYRSGSAQKKGQRASMHWRSPFACLEFSIPFSERHQSTHFSRLKLSPTYPTVFREWRHLRPAAGESTGRLASVPSINGTLFRRGYGAWHYTALSIYTVVGAHGLKKTQVTKRIGPKASRFPLLRLRTPLTTGPREWTRRSPGKTSSLYGA